MDDLARKYLPTTLTYPKNYFGAYDLKANDLCKLHKHNILQLWFPLETEFPHMIEGNTYIHKPRELLIIPPHVYHHMDTRAKEAHWLFLDIGENCLDLLDLFPDSSEKDTLFNLIYLRPLMLGSKTIHPVELSPEAARKIEDSMFDLVDASTSAAPCTAMYIRSKLGKLFSIIAEENAKTIPQEEARTYAAYRSSISNAFSYIDENITRPISLDEVYKIAHMSRSKFCFIFKQLVGLSFTEYVNVMRTHMAKKLLEETNVSITVISEKCGYLSDTYFSRIFKRYTRYTPSEYRKRMRFVNSLALCDKAN